VSLNTFIFGALILLSLAIFFYIGKFRASAKQRDRDDKIGWDKSKFSSLKILIWVMVSVLGIALLANSFI
tara:strand:+ start:173 stop:382 length:210 start_codon:yes stop_codon:yes gene_type:complete